MLLTKVAQVRSTQLTAGLKPVTCMAIYRTRIADMCSFGDEVQSFVKNRRAKARIVCVCERERERERGRERDAPVSKYRSAIHHGSKLCGVEGR